ncbi:MAG TPA: type III pantothenate kinase, partial [Saprospiraceae bacterium]|nr:type III pantothenate kinase [Saprospiraceae bacterium]
MQLCIDIGNSRVKSAVFDGHELVVLERHPSFLPSLHENWILQYNIVDIILSSTRADVPEISTFLQGHPQCLVLDHATPLPIALAYQRPQTLGKDRLAA